MINIQRGESFKVSQNPRTRSIPEEGEIDPDRHIWENYMEISRKSFRHFMVWKFWKCCKI
jgi:hypothetical protein